MARVPPPPEPSFGKASWQQVLSSPPAFDGLPDLSDEDDRDDDSPSEITCRAWYRSPPDKRESRGADNTVPGA
ncbi:MAG: hypothetical protein JWP48_7488, partial [Actinoallomurus sp.]|nr:hypothetical protein [Actinoallomurus sp.]